MEERIENFEKGQNRQRNLLQKEREEQKNMDMAKPILKLISTLDNLKLAFAHTDSKKEVLIEGEQTGGTQIGKLALQISNYYNRCIFGYRFNPEFMRP